MLLTRKLSRKEQEEILYTLFDFRFEDDVLYNQEGSEFYGYVENCEFDFSTLAGIFSYMAHISLERGKFEAQYDIQQALGL